MGVNVNVQTNKLCTPLHFSVGGTCDDDEEEGRHIDDADDKDVVALITLLKNQATLIDAQDIKGRTPLIICAQRGLPVQTNILV